MIVEKLLSTNQEGEEEKTEVWPSLGTVVLCLGLNRKVVVDESRCILEIFPEHPVQEGIRDFFLLV